jgi:hypothetical protein
MISFLFLMTDFSYANERKSQAYNKGTFSHCCTANYYTVAFSRWHLLPIISVAAGAVATLQMADFRPGA